MYRTVSREEKKRKCSEVKHPRHKITKARQQNIKAYYSWPKNLLIPLDFKIVMVHCTS